MSRNTGSVASSDSSWLKLYAAVAVLPLALAACGGGGGGGGSAPLTPTPAPAPTPAPTPSPSPAPTSIGQNWTNVSVGSVGNLVGVDYDDNLFVAVSDTGAAVTSPDLATWTPATLLSSNVSTDHLKAYGIGHIGSNFVAYGSTSPAPYTTSTGAVATSSDGVTWTMASLPAGATPIHGLIEGTRLIGLGEGGHLYASTNGQTWSVLTTIIPATGAPAVGTFNAGAYGAGGHYVGVGDNGYLIESSDDGAHWSSAQVVTVNNAGVNMHGIVWTGTQFVAVGDNGVITTSTNGTAWPKLYTSAIPGALRSVTVSSNGVIVIVGDNGIETSTDGINWTARNASGVAQLTGASFGNNAFVAVGAANTVKTSTN
jgi:hypothetical protein